MSQKQDVEIGATWKGLNRLISPSMLDETESPDTVDTGPDQQVLGLLGPRRGRTKIFNRNFDIRGVGSFNLPWDRFLVVVTNGTYEAVVYPWPTLITTNANVLTSQNYIGNDDFSFTPSNALFSDGGFINTGLTVPPWGYWRATNENPAPFHSSFDFTRVDGIAAGVLSRYAGRFTKLLGDPYTPGDPGDPRSGTSGKVGVWQTLTGYHTAWTRNNINVVAGISIRTNVARSMRLALVKNIGVEDDGNALLDYSGGLGAWNADYVDPTLLISALYAKEYITAKTINSTTLFTDFTITAPVPSNCRNLVLFVFSNTQFAVGDWMEISRCYLCAGTEAKAWIPLPYGIGQARANLETNP